MIGDDWDDDTDDSIWPYLAILAVYIGCVVGLVVFTAIVIRHR